MAAAKWVRARRLAKGWVLKVKCQSRELLEAVNLVNGVVSGHSTRPILQSLQIDADPTQGLMIRGTDMEVGLSIRVDEVHVEDPGKVVVTANRLHAILREARGEETSLVTEADGMLVVASGNSRFKVACGPVEEFPELDFKPPSPSLRCRREPFLLMLQRAAVAAARDATRFQMHSVLFDSTNGELRLVSTDGKRMVVCQEDLDREGQEGRDLPEGQFIVPLKGVDLLSKILTLEAVEDIDLHLDQTEISYASDRVSLSCRLVEGRYPEYERALPENDDFVYDLPTDELQVALRQAAIMTTKETNSVLFTFQGDQLVISAHASNIGESRIELTVQPVKTQDESFVVSFNPGFLLDMIKAANVQVLRGCFKDRKTAGLFCIPDIDKAFRHVVMPLVANE